MMTANNLGSSNVEHDPIRKIIHVDMDAFFASVEQRDNPQLRGKPVAVGSESARGVVAAASYEARAFGVHSAMPSVTARRLCPELIFAKPRFEVYQEVSSQIRKIFSQHTDLIEPLSLDEAYLDVTAHKQGQTVATNIALMIRKQIKQATGLNASAGISYNKFLAKIASDLNKPNGQAVITPEKGPLFVAKLPVKKIHGIGPATTAKMEQLGIATGADLRNQSADFLRTHFGKVGQWYYQIARGIDNRPVESHRIRKSLGAETTFSDDIQSFEPARDAILPLIEKLWRYCQHHGIAARTITLKVKYADFQQITRSRTVIQPISSHDDLISWSDDLLAELFPTDKGIRLLGVRLSSLDHGAEKDHRPTQLLLWQDQP